MFNLFATGVTQPPTAGLQDAPGTDPASGASTARGAAEPEGSNPGGRDVDSGSDRTAAPASTIGISGYPEIRISGYPDIRITGFPGIRKSGFPDIRFS